MMTDTEIREVAAGVAEMLKAKLGEVRAFVLVMQNAGEVEIVTNAAKLEHVPALLSAAVEMTSETGRTLRPS